LADRKSSIVYEIVSSVYQ